MSSARWPYPHLFAHRGGGTLAPENTIAGIRAGIAHGYRAIEFDVMLSKDGVPVVMHDPDFGRTVKASGSIATTLAADLDHTDAGSWFGAEFAGEPVPRFAAFVEFCKANEVFMNVEIKPSPGQDEKTGEVVAAMTAALYENEPASVPRPLFSSFKSIALAAARRVAPQIARGYLMDSPEPDWARRLGDLECVSLHCNHKCVDEAFASSVRAANFGLFCYTVNDPERARELLGWGVDAFCTDRIDLIDPGMAPWQRATSSSI